jgi:hypothetical protein
LHTGWSRAALSAQKTAPTCTMNAPPREPALRPWSHSVVSLRCGWAGGTKGSQRPHRCPRALGLGSNGEPGVSCQLESALASVKCQALHKCPIIPAPIPIAGVVRKMGAPQIAPCCRGKGPQAAGECRRRGTDGATTRQAVGGGGAAGGEHFAKGLLPTTPTCPRPRRVQLVQGRDEACPVSTRGGTKLVQLVREGRKGGTQK